MDEKLLREPVDTDSPVVSSEPHIQFLYFEACPNAQQALTLLRKMLRTEGLTTSIEMIAVETDAAAQEYRFYGSPTIRVNGVDVGAPDTAATPSLACRLYAQPDGRYAPHPPVDALAQALRQARRDV